MTYKARAKRKEIQKVILKTIGVAGLLSVALLAPNALAVLDQFGLLKSKRRNEYIKNSRNRLIHSGYIEYRGDRLRLTKKGERELRRLEMNDYQFTHTGAWDGKWRVLIFDIEEKRKHLREKVRRTLQSVGFARLQDSVWIFPYDCEDLITLLKVDFKIGKDLLYLIVEKLEYDQKYREKFELVR